MSLDLDKSIWKRVAFGDVVKNLNVTVRHTAAAGVDRIIAMEHLDPGELKISRWGSPEDGTTFTRRVRPGQTIFGKRRAYQRKVAYAEFDAICSGDILVFEAAPTLLLPEFLPFIVQSNSFYHHALGTSAGSLSPRTNWRDLATFEFELPPLDEQQRIADLLWAIERHRHALARVEARGNEVIQDYFSEVLGRGEGHTRPATELIAEMTVGVVVRPTQYYTNDAKEGIPALRGLNILPGRFDLGELVYFRTESARELAKSTLRVDDVVIVRTGRPGDAAVVSDAEEGFNCIDLIIARPGSDLLPGFLAMFLNSEFGRVQIGRHSAGTAQQHFNVGALKKLQLPALTIDEQVSVVSTAEVIRKLLRAAKAENVSLQALSRSVLAEMFGDGE